MTRSTHRLRRLAVLIGLMGVCGMLQACLVAAVVGTAAGVGGAVVGGAVKGTEAVGRAIIPLAEPDARAQRQP